MALLYRSLMVPNCLPKPCSKYFQLQSRNVVMKVSSVKPAIVESYEDKNLRLNRPLSPHLSIYKPQLTSMLSITHRMTGVALSVYAVAFATASVFPGNFPQVVESIQNLHLAAPVLFSSKLILSFPVAFHVCNGIRHLVWDLGKALTIKQVYNTGYIMIGTSAVVAFILASL
uniref:Uncharacterized protein n=1 Tax=Clastoptera arizonana TaxID=38151 RepID=A0A1B6CXW0_9HEMI